MLKAIGLVLSVAALLGGCGGGGGGGGGGAGGEETLYVSVNYPNPQASLYQQVNVVPHMDGFRGRTPRCTLLHGPLPAGLSLQPDCSITGRAMEEANNWVFTVRVGANGVSNTLDFSGWVTVRTPNIYYSTPSWPFDVPLGQGVSDAVQVSNWTAAPDLTMAWSYQHTGGSFPTGLTLDPVNGTVSGTAQARGSFTAYVQATLTTQFGTLVLPQGRYDLNVAVPRVSYDGHAGSPAVAYISQAFSAGITYPGYLTISNVGFAGGLPPGLSTDAQGRITGTPAGPSTGERTYPLTATVRAGGAGEATQGTLYLAVRSPVQYRYSSDNLPIQVAAGATVDVTPTELQISAVALQPGVVRGFAPRAGWCNLPPGFTVDPLTGRVHGTVTPPGAFDCQVDVTITHNGVTWTEIALFYLRVS